ncbi:MAG: DUF4145 domain-containing protein [Candidatus Thiodiazotropha taylori]|nr:DUF4145 domain-containing protein [Candidatus Thiodiazotropha taylori]
MSSWWSIGEGRGYHGDDLALHQITCPFCMESGNFELVFREQKKKPNGHKLLNFDTYKCGNCASFIQVFWSAGDRLHDYKVQPWPLKLERYPDHWPEAVGRYWLQAKRNLKDENWDAAALMARSALQIALRDHDATGKNLYQEIDDLAEKRVLPPIMQEWSHNVRELGNDSAHPKPEQEATNPIDAKDIVQFLDFLLEYLYTLPKRISDYREREGSSS